MGRLETAEASGRPDDSAAAATPGRFPMRSIRTRSVSAAWRTNAFRASIASWSIRPPPLCRGLPGVPTPRVATTTLAVSSPRSRVTNATKLRSSSPAPVRRTRASAICTTASPACPRFVRRRPRPPPAPPCPALRVRAASTRDQARAGAAPNSRPAATDRPAANASTTPSRATSARPGTFRGTRDGAARTIPAATATPAAPPAAPRSTLSVSSCRATRPRPAPSAPRMASSRRRAMPRARSRPVTLAQAISSTSPVAAPTIASASRKGRARSSRRRTTRASGVRSGAGNQGSSARCRSSIARTSACARAGVTPGRRRPMPSMNPGFSSTPPEDSYGATTSGVQNWAEE